MTDPSIRLSRAARAVIATTLAAVALLASGIPMFMYPGTAYTGVHFHRTGAVVQQNLVYVDAGSSAYKAGLRSGDIVSCLSIRD